MQTPRAHRGTELIKELVRKGHEVTVYAVLGSYDYSAFLKEFPITLKSVPVRFQWHPYSSDADGKRYLIDKILGRILGRKYFFPEIEFYYCLPKALATEVKHDYVISIADPHSLHWGVANFKKQYPEKFPAVWTADCGDPFMFAGKAAKHLQKFERYERMFCAACNYITVPFEKAKEAYYEEYRSKIRAIPQGFNFDLSLVENRTPKPINQIPRFAFAGMFINDIRNPQLILEHLAQSARQFVFEVFTPYTELLQPYMGRLANKLVIHRPIERQALLHQLAQMDFVLNIENLNSPTQLPSKLIDYAISGRPILSLNPQQPDYDKIDRFLEGDYTGRFTVDVIENYHISNVADKFLELAK